MSEASISVNASSDEEAREIANQKALDGMVHWIECGDEIVPIAELVVIGDCA